MAKKGGLGRGLDALLSSAGQQVIPAHTDAMTVLEIPLDLLCRGAYQARQDFDDEALQELAASIRTQGVLQPVLVRTLAANPERHERYEILAGERRWRAAQLAGLASIPAIVKTADNRAAMAIGLIENLQRDNLNPLEEAQGLSQLAEDFGLTHQQIAEALGKSRAMVSNLLRLLDLTDEVKEMISTGGLEMGHARALLALKGADQVDAGYRVVSQGLSVRETEKLVKRIQELGQQALKAKPVAVDVNVQGLESRLSAHLGAPVSIRQGKKGKGKLVISYHSLDELDGIISRFG